MSLEKYLAHKERLQKEAAASDPERRKQIEGTLRHLPKIYVGKYGEESVPSEDYPHIEFNNKTASSNPEDYVGGYEIKGSTPWMREQSRRFLERYHNNEIPDIYDVLRKHGYNG